MKYYVCKKMRLMIFLQNNGFNFIKTQKDRNNPHYIVWIYEDTPILRDAIEVYYNGEEFINRKI